MLSCSSQFELSTAAMMSSSRDVVLFVGKAHKQGGVAQRIDQARYAARVAMNDLERVCANRFFLATGNDSR